MSAAGRQIYRNYIWGISVAETARKLEASQDVSIEYTPVPRSQVLARETAIADLFVQVGVGKMVKVAHKGAKIETDRIERLGEKSVETLFVVQGDFSEVVEGLANSAKLLSVSSGLSNEQVLENYVQVAEAVLTELTRLPLTKESLTRASQVATEISDRLQQTDDLAKGLRMIFNLSENFSRHTIGVVVMANWLASQLGWTSNRILHPMTMGAMLHDIGKRELPVHLIDKERILLTPQEVVLYETHPTRGVMMLKGFEQISPETLRIISEHHEIPNGQGFPHNLRGERMLPLSRVVSFADVLAHEVLDPLLAKKALNIDNILERLETVYKVMYGSELVKAARGIFKKDK